jgi:hypothetical protein
MEIYKRTERGWTVKEAVMIHFTVQAVTYTWCRIFFEKLIVTQLVKQ